MAFVNPNTPFIGMMVFSNIIKTILAKTNIKETIKREPFLGDLEKLIFSLMLLFVELIIGKRLFTSGIIIPKIKAINAFNKEKVEIVIFGTVLLTIIFKSGTAVSTPTRLPKKVKISDSNAYIKIIFLKNKHIHFILILF